DYISAGFIHSGDSTVDAQSIPRNRGGTEDDSTVRDDADLAVSAVCDPLQGCHRLTLRSGAEYHDFVLFNLIDHLRFDECFRRCFDIAELRTDVDVVFHAASENADLTVDFYGCIDCLLLSVDIRSTRSEDDLYGTFIIKVFYILLV